MWPLEHIDCGGAVGGRSFRASLENAVKVRQKAPWRCETVQLHNRPFLVRHISLALIQVQLRRSADLVSGKRLHPPAAAVFLVGVNRI